MAHSPETTLSTSVCPAPESAYTDDRSRWRAIITRDPAADGVFVYSVRTTGVYCRPHCSSRRPRRANVAFHANWQQAEKAGFRACRRCRPQSHDSFESRRRALIAACRRLESGPIPVHELAAGARMSPAQFHRLFRKLTGTTPRAYADAVRAGQLRRTLSQMPEITAAYLAAGFSSAGSFYQASPARLGMTPTAFRTGGRGETIRFAVGETSLGSILVAATEKGVCALSLGDDPEVLLREFEDRFSRAQLIGGDSQFDQWVARAIACVEQPASTLELPLDIRGTAFQVRVWQELQRIPAGSTASYAEIARRIGRPSSARAVGAACAANCIAVVVPCHRVVRTDGDLSGYRWGLKRKAELLRRELAPRNVEAR